MRYETTMNHVKRLEGHVREIFWCARAQGYSHARILDERKRRIFDDPAWAKLPGWATQRVSLAFDAESDRIFSPDLSASQLEKTLADAIESGEAPKAHYVRWALFLDGSETTTDIVCDIRNHGREDVWNDVAGCHVWNHDTTRHYSPMRLLNR